jgi:hypothetical protein
VGCAGQKRAVHGAIHAHRRRQPPGAAAAHFRRRSELGAAGAGGWVAEWTKQGEEWWGCTCWVAPRPSSHVSHRHVMMRMPWRMDVAWYGATKGLSVLHGGMTPQPRDLEALLTRVAPTCHDDDDARRMGMAWSGVAKVTPGVDRTPDLTLTKGAPWVDSIIGVTDDG